MKKEIYLLIILCVWSFSISSFSQSKTHSNRPPWIIGKASSWQVGELPHVELRDNLLKVKFGVGKNRENAQQAAIHDFLKDIVSTSGNTLTGKEQQTSISESQKSGKKERSNHFERYENNININGKTIARYAIIDEYYEYNNGAWHYAGLFLLAEDGVTLANLPPLTYGLDRGAWRSILIPGWAQLYQGRTKAGIGYMTIQAGLIGSTIYLNNMANYYKRRQNEAYSINIKEDYKKRYDQTKMYANISAGVCAAWYILNIVDAFSSKHGKLYYTTAYKQTQFTLSPTVINSSDSPSMGVACTFNF